MREYLNLLKHILRNGDHKEDRTGTGTVSTFGSHLTVDLKDRFPLLTTKHVHFKSVAHELLWFLSGDMFNHYLQDHGVTIWDEWADEDGFLGPVYGVQWRDWIHRDCAGNLTHYDQLQIAIDEIRANPDSRRMIVSAWNPGELNDMALPPCHLMSQFNVTNGKLKCHMYQRSADVFLGVPFNIASYALLTRMVAKITGLHADKLHISFGDAHIYTNHIPMVLEQLSRPVKEQPYLLIHGDQKEIDDFCYEDFELKDYDPYPTIKAPIAV
jgi:thymidylate synthase